MSSIAIVAQIPQAFDYPGIPWPSHFHYTGPFSDPKGREAIGFDRKKLTRKPLIYASMGTLLNGDSAMYRAILHVADARPDVQMVLVCAEHISLDDLGRIPANVILVSKAPQLELLQRASLCITHAGMNTALEALAEGAPMVAIPVVYDQPGVAARIRHHAVGAFVEWEKVTPARLLKAVNAVLANPAYTENARRFQTLVRSTGGLATAAKLIEAAFAMARA